MKTIARATQIDANTLGIYYRMTSLSLPYTHTQSSHLRIHCRRYFYHGRRRHRRCDEKCFILLLWRELNWEMRRKKQQKKQHSHTLTIGKYKNIDNYNSIMTIKLLLFAVGTQSRDVLKFTGAFIVIQHAATSSTISQLGALQMMNSLLNAL